jgi:Cap4 SAVED domain
MNDASGTPSATTAPVSRNRLLQEWLTAEPESQHLRFAVTWLSEVDGIRQAIVRPLSETVFLHHNDPAITKKKLARLGYQKLSDEIDRRPKSHNTRLGSFGEVIASEFLRQLRGYDIPVYRLRYNTNDDSSPKGDDVLAFEFADRAQGKKDTVIVAEVKVRSQFKSTAVDEAHEALRKGFRPRPKSFQFVVDILFREGRDEEAYRLRDLSQKFGKRSLTRRSCLFLVTGNSPAEPFACLVGKRLAPGLEAVQLTLGELASFINEVFDSEVDLDAL